MIPLRKIIRSISPGVKVILIGAAGNVGLSCIKLIGGVLGGSPALLNDAFHSLSDLATDGIALLTYKIGRLPRDPNHPYGHGKAESIGSSFIGLCVLLAGIGLAWVSIQFLMQPDKVGHSFLEDFGGMKSFVVDRTAMEIAAGFAFISILIKEWLFRYTRQIGEEENSPTLIANAWHHRSDALSSIAALVGIGGAIAGYPIMDPLAGIVVALMIAKSGVDITKEGVSDLMDTAIDDEDLDAIIEAAREIPGVISLHDVRSRKVGGEVLIDLHALVDPECSVTEGHHIGENLRKRLIHKFSDVEDILVHIDTEEPDGIEPVYQTDSLELRRLAAAALEPFSDRLTPTRLRLHFYSGDVLVEAILKPDLDLPADQYASILKEVREKLEAVEEIQCARVYLDV
ncbi:MAG: cation transporter [Candidatus Nitronauta litoralis]|uniref:Cation transporter n=1 Tax=Candidatus Nitronauta litoralis TaxID=2705533 RepID=A0A7T0G0J5_9BACT|nr:MAG: cation transporter [Candidatus Nitronauta litoralis]